MLHWLSAGWFLTWRVGPIVAAFALVTAGVLSPRRMCGGPDVINLGLWVTMMSLAALVASVRAQPLAAIWTRRRYGRELDRPVRWPLVWRAVIATLGTFDFVVLAPVPGVMVIPVFAVLNTVGWGWALKAAVAPPEPRGQGRCAALQANVTPRVATVAITVTLVGAALPNASTFRTGCGVAGINAPRVATIARFGSPGTEPDRAAQVPAPRPSPR